MKRRLLAGLVVLALVGFVGSAAIFYACGDGGSSVGGDASGGAGTSGEDAGSNGDVEIQAGVS